jgi:hypothetical protein
MAGKRAGQRAMRLLEGSDSRRLLADPWSRLGPSERSAFPLLRGRIVSWEDLNLRPQPYQAYSRDAFKQLERWATRSSATCQ